jgi:transposase InsO family protein
VTSPRSVRTSCGSPTYVRPIVGLFYLAMGLDVFSRRITGWMMSESLRTELVLAALEMAVHHRDTGTFVVDTADESDVIHHSDHGCPVHQLCVQPAPGRHRHHRLAGFGR